MNAPEQHFGQQWGARLLLIATHVASLLPLALLIWGYLNNQLTADPIREITRRSGRTALILLVLSLACTPAAVMLRFKLASRLRRPLGLYSFAYAAVHVLTFVGLDYGFDWTLIAPEIVQKRFVQVGLLAFLILLALAVTSTKGWVRRLGKNWKRLHRLAYVAALLVIVHFVWTVKAAPRLPYLYGAIVLVLLMIRIPRLRRLFSFRRRQDRSKTQDV